MLPQMETSPRPGTWRQVSLTNCADCTVISDTFIITPNNFSLFPGHSKHEFAHNNPIMTKIKSGHHGKHRKISDPTADNVRKKHRKPSTQAQHLSGIQEGEKEPEEDKEESTESSQERSVGRWRKIMYTDAS